MQRSWRDVTGEGGRESGEGKRREKEKRCEEELDARRENEERGEDKERREEDKEQGMKRNLRRRVRDERRRRWRKEKSRGPTWGVLTAAVMKASEKNSSDPDTRTRALLRACRAARSTTLSPGRRGGVGRCMLGVGSEGWKYGGEVQYWV